MAEKREVQGGNLQARAAPRGIEGYAVVQFTITPAGTVKDPIIIDAVNNRIDVRLPDEELAARRAAWKQPAPRYTQGVLAKYAKLVATASEGAVTDKYL